MMIYIYRYTYIHYIPFHCIALQYITFAFTLNICLYIYTNWWFQPPLKKYESQIGSSSQLLGKIKNSMVPNHQPLYIYICIYVWSWKRGFSVWRYVVLLPSTGDTSPSWSMWGSSPKLLRATQTSTCMEKVGDLFKTGWWYIIDIFIWNGDINGNMYIYIYILSIWYR